jgi:hypothetical protein
VALVCSQAFTWATGKDRPFGWFRKGPVSPARWLKDRKRVSGSDRGDDGRAGEDHLEIHTWMAARLLESIPAWTWAGLNRSSISCER